MVYNYNVSIADVSQSYFYVFKQTISTGHLKMKTVNWISVVRSNDIRNGCIVRIFCVPTFISLQCFRRQLL